MTVFRLRQINRAHWTAWLPLVPAVAVFIILQFSKFQDFPIDWDEYVVAMNVWSLHHPEAAVYGPRDLGVIQDGLLGPRERSAFVGLNYEWTKLVGTSLDGFRSLSVLSGLGCIVIVFLLASWFFSPIAGGLAALYLSVNLVFMEFSAIARYETTYILFWFSAILIIVRHRTNEKLFAHVAAALLMSIALVISPRPWVGIFGCTAAYLVGNVRSAVRSRCFYIFCALVSVAVFFEIYRSGRSYLLHASTYEVYSPPLRSYLPALWSRLLAPFSNCYFSYISRNSVNGAFYWVSGSLFLLFSTIWVVSRGEPKTRLFIWIFVVQMVPAILLFSAPIVWIPAIVWLSMAVGATILHLGKRLPRMGSVTVMAFIFFGILVLCTFSPIFFRESLLLPMMLLSLSAFAGGRLFMVRNIVLLIFASLLVVTFLPDTLLSFVSHVLAVKMTFFALGSLGLFWVAGMLFRSEVGFWKSAARTAPILVFFFIFLSHTDQLIRGNAWLPYPRIKQRLPDPVGTDQFGVSSDARVIGEDATWPTFRRNPFFGIDCFVNMTLLGGVSDTLIAKSAAAFRPVLFAITDQRVERHFGVSRVPEEWFRDSWGVRGVYMGQASMGGSIQVYRLLWGEWSEPRTVGSATKSLFIPFRSKHADNG